MTTRVLSASSLSGTKVRNPLGESIGDVKDLMVDWKNGKVVYAVLSFGGFLGIGDKLFAIPIESFDFKSPDGEEFAVLDIDKAKLENAPGFDKDNWPQNADYSFIDSVYSHYGYEPYSSRFPDTFR
ncbi:MAG: PRC-barrel domain-containing protein [Lentimicrobium sp.]|jgi:sporulation protein YlmC with PRC-barrel domain|nr:PRC-barrel domain-containing protein [Lentimicrobium sp.]